MLSAKVTTPVLLLTGFAVIGGAGTTVYISSVSATIGVTTVLNCKSEQHPTETSRHVGPVDTGHDKRY